MSIILSLRRNSQVAILTDGAILDPNGTLWRVSRKVTISEKVPVAVAARGDAYWSMKVSRLIVGWVEQWGFDKGMEVLSDVLPQFAPKDLPYDEVEVLIAGVSETEGATHRLFVNVANGGVDPLQLIDPGPTCWMSGHTGVDESFGAIGVRAPRPGELAGSYLLDTGVRFIEFYRRFPGQLVRDKGRPCTERYQIGGQVDLTMVDPRGAKTVTIHHWPDKIGEPIVPSKDRPAVKATPITTGMNRQQRRAAERQARKLWAA